MSLRYNGHFMQQSACGHEGKIAYIQNRDFPAARKGLSRFLSFQFLAGPRFLAALGESS